MTCPVCTSPLLKSQRHAAAPVPSGLRCTGCGMRLIFKSKPEGKAASRRRRDRLPPGEAVTDVAA